MPPNGIERGIQRRSLYVDEKGNFATTSHIDKIPLPSRVRRLDYAVIPPGAGNPAHIRAAVLSKIHPDEEEVSTVLQKLLTPELPRIEAHNPHNLASILNRRGYVVPMSRLKSFFVPEENRIPMKNYKEHKHGKLGMQIDLNRQFRLSKNIATFEDVYKRVPYEEAKLLIRLFQRYPHIQYVFSFHEDEDRGAMDVPGGRGRASKQDGFYMYDMVADERNDPEKATIMALVDQLREKLLRSGFFLYSGVDDKTDPVLGFRAEAGYIYQPNIDSWGVFKLDTTLESAAVLLGQAGLLQVKRAFTFEIPYKLSMKRKSRMVRTILNSFVKPLLSAGE